MAHMGYYLKPCSKILKTLLINYISIEMVVIRDACQNSKREDPGQTASSDLGLRCLSRPFWQATSVQDFRTSTISKFKSK